MVVGFVDQAAQMIGIDGSAGQVLDGCPSRLLDFGCCVSLCVRNNAAKCLLIALERVYVIAKCNSCITKMMGLSSLMEHNNSNPPNFHSPALVVKIEATLTLPCTKSQSLFKNLMAF